MHPQKPTYSALGLNSLPEDNTDLFGGGGVSKDSREESAQGSVKFSIPRDYKNSVNEGLKNNDSNGENEENSISTMQPDTVRSDEAGYSYGGDEDDENLVETVTGDDRQVFPYFVDDYPGAKIKTSPTDDEADFSDDDTDWDSDPRPFKKAKTVMWRPPTPPLVKQQVIQGDGKVDSLTPIGYNFDVYMTPILTPSDVFDLEREAVKWEFCLPSVTEEVETLEDNQEQEEEEEDKYARLRLMHTMTSGLKPASRKRHFASYTYEQYKADVEECKAESLADGGMEYINPEAMM
jgi:hypothetical protein